MQLGFDLAEPPAKPLKSAPFPYWLGAGATGDDLTAAQVARDTAVLNGDPEFHVPDRAFYEERITALRGAPPTTPPTDPSASGRPPEPPQ
jgi:hypothetical protein